MPLSSYAFDEEKIKQIFNIPENEKIIKIIKFDDESIPKILFITHKDSEK